MRKSLALLIAASFALLLIGCSSDDKAASQPASSEENFKLESEGAAKSSAQATAPEQQETAQAQPNAIENRYNQSCFACHGTGAAGAPRKGDVEAWKPRLAKGMDVMLENTKNGYKAMPPKGMCFDCSDEEYVALIQFMAK